MADHVGTVQEAWGSYKCVSDSYELEGLTGMYLLLCLVSTYRCRMNIFVCKDDVVDY